MSSLTYTHTQALQLEAKHKHNKTMADVEIIEQQHDEAQDKLIAEEYK